MSNDTIREILEAYVKAGFPTLQPDVLMHFANTRFKTPATAWIHVAVIPNLKKRANIGSQEEYAAMGIVNVTCMVPETTSTKPVRQIGDAIDTVLMDRQIAIPGGGHISTYGSTYRDRGVINGFYTANVFISWRARVRLVR